MAYAEVNNPSETASMSLFMVYFSFVFEILSPMRVSCDAVMEGD